MANTKKNTKSEKQSLQTNIYNLNKSPSSHKKSSIQKMEILLEGAQKKMQIYFTFMRASSLEILDEIDRQKLSDVYILEANASTMTDSCMRKKTSALPY